MSEPIISVSGLRGLIGEQLTPIVAANYIAALASSLPAHGQVVLGRDGRASGSMLSNVVAATLNAHGLDCLYLDVASTPTVGVEVRERKAIAGIQISASHNPKQYNGLKLFGSNGRVLPKADGEKVLQGYRSGASRWVDVDQLGRSEPVEDTTSAHLKLVLDTVDVETIRSKQFKVLVDSNNGAGSILARRLLGELGCDTTIIGDTPNGQFAHTPEPLAHNLTTISARAEQGQFDAVFCQDPDADRLAIIDENGKFIGEELTLALCLMQALPKQSGTIVTNCATSSVSKDVAQKLGCNCLQSAVGEANVADLMLAEGAVFGGEGNGGPIDPKVGYVRDSFVGMARILELLASSQKTLSQLVAELPVYSMVKDKLEMDTSGLPALFEKLVDKMSDAEASQPDGLKLQWSDRWLLIRGSNTEPIVRFIAEAPTTAEAQALCDVAKSLV